MNDFRRPAGPARCVSKNECFSSLLIPFGMKDEDPENFVGFQHRMGTTETGTAGIVFRAFVRNRNDYSDEVLYKKDGFESINVNNYLIKNVKLKRSEVFFENLFSSLITENLCNGVIKIDVEGFERKVLLAIAKSIPLSLNVIIVFENWDPEFDLDEIKTSFEGREVKCFKFERSIRGTNKSKIRKFFEFIFFGDKIMLGNFNEDKALIGDIILQIN